MSKLTVGVTLRSVDPPAEFVEGVKRIEGWGYDHLWVTDSSLHGRYCYSLLTLAATNSQTLQLGTNCTHPHTRHPAMNANAITTINEVSGGRAILGIGAGDSPVEELGYRVAKVAEVKAMVEVSRGLYAGKRFDFEGPHFTMRNGAMHYGLEGLPEPKIYLTASGPKMLELAGEIADGVIVHCGAFREGLEFAVERVKAGAERAGRDIADVDIAWHLFGALDTDVAAARDAARSHAAWFPKRSPFYCKLAGMTDAQIEAIRAAYSGGHAHEAKAAIDLTTDEMVDKFTVAGDADVWQERISMAAEVGINHIELLPDADRYGLMDKLMTTVFSPLRA